MGNSNCCYRKTYHQKQMELKSKQQSLQTDPNLQEISLDSQEINNQLQQQLTPKNTQDFELKKQQLIQKHFQNIEQKYKQQAIIQQKKLSNQQRLLIAVTYLLQDQC